MNEKILFSEYKYRINKDKLLLYKAISTILVSCYVIIFVLFMNVLFQKYVIVTFLVATVSITIYMFDTIFQNINLKRFSKKCVSVNHIECFLKYNGLYEKEEIENLINNLKKIRTKNKSFFKSITLNKILQFIFFN